MDYVDGECFHDFSEMTLPMIEACDKSVLDLHKCRVLHGDLQPWNFILRRVKNSNSFFPLSILIFEFIYKFSFSLSF